MALTVAACSDSSSSSDGKCRGALSDSRCATTAPADATSCGSSLISSVTAKGFGGNVCVYSGTTRALVGAYLVVDSPSLCGGTSFARTDGTIPADVRVSSSVAPFDGFDVACPNGDGGGG